jgi:hypothetical protein
MNVIKEIEEWFERQCDGDWEHSYGFKIQNLDNPGWLVDIDIVDTELEDKEFTQINIARSDDDWIHCKVEEKVFKGRGGICNLEEILSIFVSWSICKGA